MLIAKGVDVNCCTDGGHSALQYAASRDRHEIVELLLHHHADPNKKDDRGATPLHRAGKLINSYWVSVFSFIHTNNGKKITIFYLFIIASKGNLKCVKVLLQHSNRINLDAQDCMGSTPL